MNGNDLVRKYPNNIPIIINSRDIALRKYKFIVPRHITFGHFLNIIRKKGIEDSAITHSDSIFMFIGNVLPKNTEIISVLYSEHKNVDGFLICTLHKENSFGK
jgi:hypothetical protein